MSKIVLYIKLQIQRILGIAAVLFASLSQVSIAYADVLSDQLDAATSSDYAESFTQAVLNFSIPAGFIALIGLVVYGSYLLMTSQGNPEAIGEAREVITNAVLGFLLIALSVAVLLLIQDVFQLPI